MQFTDTSVYNLFSLNQRVKGYVNYLSFLSMLKSVVDESDFFWSYSATLTMSHFRILPPLEKLVSYIDEQDEVVVSHNNMCEFTFSCVWKSLNSIGTATDCLWCYWDGELQQCQAVAEWDWQICKWQCVQTSSRK